MVCYVFVRVFVFEIASYACMCACIIVVCVCVRIRAMRMYPPMFLYLEKVVAGSCPLVHITNNNHGSSHGGMVPVRPPILLSCTDSLVMRMHMLLMRAGLDARGPWLPLPLVVGGAAGRWYAQTGRPVT